MENRSGRTGRSYSEELTYVYVYLLLCSHVHAHECALISLTERSTWFLLGGGIIQGLPFSRVWPRGVTKCLIVFPFSSY